MNLFALIKANVTTRQVAIAYGLPVSRSGMCRCIFHDDRDPSMWVSDGYYCHACQARGSVIDFTAKLFSLSPMQAAQKLAADFALKESDRDLKSDLQQRAAYLDRQQKREEALRLTDALFSRREVTLSTMHRFEPCPDSPWDHRWARACIQKEEIDRLLDLAVSTDEDDRRLFIPEATAWLHSTLVTG